MGDNQSGQGPTACRQRAVVCYNDARSCPGCFIFTTPERRRAEPRGRFACINPR